MNPVPLFLIIVSLPLLLGGCKADFSGMKKGDRIIFRTKESNGKFTNGDRTVREGWPEISNALWFVSASGGYLTYRRVDVSNLSGPAQWTYRIKSADSKYPKKKIIWIKKHPNQVPMPKMKSEIYLDAKGNLFPIFKPEDHVEIKLQKFGPNSEQDLYYEGDSDTLYTGRVIMLHGSLEGLPDRSSLYYFEYSDALFQTYRPNKEGRMPACGIGELKDGKRDGVWTVYRQSDGSKVSESFYKEGRKVSDDKYWNRKGETVDSREEALTNDP